eukprot:PhF_6_TR7039/c0_g1_i1/m.10569/K03099/SOS; son of sevenless
MADAYLSRLRVFYSHYAPEKIHTIPSLVQHYDEEKLMKILTDKYGPEPSSPKGRSAANAAPMSPKTSTSSPSLASQNSAVPNPLLLSLVLQHLKASKYTAAAETFMSECNMLDLSTDSILSGEHDSVLGLLTTPAPATLHALSVLLKNIPDKLMEHLPRQYDTATMMALASMASEPVWSEPETQMFKSEDGESIRAASINGLVEKATEVIIQPHVTLSAAHIERDAAFVDSLIQWHRHFTHPHVLLAKLIQRSIVPETLPVHDTYRGHGIRIENRGNPIARMKLIAQLQNMISLKVLTFVSVWIHQCPVDWQDTMVQCVLLFLESAGTKSVSHMQCAESIRIGLSTLSSRQTEIPFTSSLQRNPKFAPPKSLGDDAAPPPEDFPTSILAVDPMRFALQWTAANHKLFRKILPMELIAHILRCNSIPDTQQQPTVCQNLTQFNAQFNNLFYFVVNQIVSDPDVKGRVNKMAYFSSLLQCFVGINNLNAAFAVSLALRHPALHRMKNTVTLYRKEHEKHEKAEHYFHSHISRSLAFYKKYLESIQDTETYPVLPVVGALVREMRFLEFSEPLALVDGNRYVVHWRKFAVFEEMVSMMKRYQAVVVPPEVSILPHFQYWLNTLVESVPHSDEDLHRLSCLWEP